MKHIYTIVFLFFSIIALAKSPFQLEETEIDFNEVNKVEALVNQNPDLTFEKIEAKNPELVQNFDSNSKFSASAFLTESDTLIPPFWWGFCLGIWGLIIVLIITDKDKNAVNSAFKGCIAMGVTVLAVYGIIVLLSLTAATSI